MKPGSNSCGCWRVRSLSDDQHTDAPISADFHPTDFSAADSAAFAHAVKLTCLVQGQLTMMHIDPTIERKAFEDFPRIRALPSRWRILPEGSSKDDVAELGVKIKCQRGSAISQRTVMNNAG